ncbi:M48 family metallopeptidase [Engelhardtia mirabilis]|uniref:Peptidase M48 domain-containing protein n=1 Tax=Engelhardtia mirabilis TaxID=2528011 RepID=A0A518BIT7_9BACT|nr:hypothetical protein Pla133_19650 [Planctomycetes bacterium Pla133]QDV01216.1 hypothetical protein Pla86_19650 [Planctomycetes bacterium Pla86]
MDFFEHQEQARKRTGRLVVLFAISVALIVVAVYGVVSAVLVNTLVGDGPQVTVPAFFDPLRFALVAAGVCAVVALGSLYKTAQLASGGRAVADMMGGRHLEGGSADPLERRLLNVVEEMAIASGMPVPPVYVMDREDGINAFAAGKQPGDAVIGVTRGCMEKLSRDELQGVVAHEFSHVFNGDMRLNLRLIGVLHGILVLGLVGQYVFRSAIYAPRRSNREGGSAVVVALAAGAALAVLGAIGTFFGQVIQAAVSRQREFLADASAVQFTRNPGGIGGALKKIGGFPSHAKVMGSHAAEVSHMLFGEPGTMNFGGLLATHPPLLERIRRIEPAFDGRVERLAEPTDAELQGLRSKVAAELAARNASGPGAVAMGLAADGALFNAADLAAARARAGDVDQLDNERARELLASIPPLLRRSAGDPFAARAVVLALALEPEDAGRARQFEALEALGDLPLVRELRRLVPSLGGLAPEARLPLLQLALAPLHQLDPKQYAAFVRALDMAIESDNRVELFEMTLRRIVRHHLDRAHGLDATPAGGRELQLSQAGARAAVVLGLLVRAGHGNSRSAELAFRAAGAALGVQIGDRVPDAGSTLRSFDTALEALARLRPGDKRRFLQACEAAIARDGQVTRAEAELYRAIAETLDCPVPPLVAGQPLAVAR